MKRVVFLAALLGLVLLLAGCQKTAPQALAFDNAPWDDGEESYYNLYDAEGNLVGTALWSWARQGDGWVQTYELTLSGRVDRGQVTLGPDLLPVSSWIETMGQRYEATYGPEQVTITTTQDGETTTETLDRPVNALDNEQTLQVQRALPLAVNYAVEYTDIVPATRASVPVELTVPAIEKTEVPAGTYYAWHMYIDFGSGQHEAWYAQDAPHVLLRYRNGDSGLEFRLRAWQPSADAAFVGDPQPPQIETQQPATSAATVTGAAEKLPINTAFVVLSFVVQYPLMLIFPMALGWWLQRRYQIGWGAFGRGALTFVISQVGHLPFNQLVGLTGDPHGVALWPLPLAALVAGLSAGVFEEGARWLGLRFVWRRLRGRPAALQYGVGHAAVESVVYGLLALSTMANILALRSQGIEQAGLTPDVAEQARQAYLAFASTPAYLPVVAGLERVFVMALHVLMSLLVMRAVTQRRPVFWLAALGIHVLVDWWAVYAGNALPTVWVELGLALLAAGAVYLIWRSRQDPLEEELLPRKA